MPRVQIQRANLDPQEYSQRINDQLKEKGAEGLKRELSAIKEWAAKQGLDLKNLPLDSMEQIKTIGQWAQKMGCQGQSIGEVAAWAAQKGFEPTGSFNVSQMAYAKAAEGVDASTLEKTDLGGEAGVNIKDFAEAMATEQPTIQSIAEALGLIESGELQDATSIAEALADLIKDGKGAFGELKEAKGIEVFAEKLGALLEKTGIKTPPNVIQEMAKLTMANLGHED